MNKTILSAGVVIVRDLSEPRYLVLRVYRYWDFPKGMVEPGEKSLEAARREVKEETGLTNLNFRWGMGYRETAPYGPGKIARYYLAESSEGEVLLPVNPALGRPEHDEFRWLSYEATRALLVPRLRRILDWANSCVRHGPTRGEPDEPRN